MATTANDDNLSDDAVGLYIDDELTSLIELNAELGKVFQTLRMASFI